MQSNSLSPMHAAPRRAFRLASPRQQARLTVAILAVSLLFAGLAIANSYIAYGSLVGVAVETAPVLVSEDIQEQTRHYLRVTSTLAVGYALAVLALSVVFVHRMLGPVVALERHARALRSGDYRSRVGLRGRGSAFSGVATQLNDLAKQLERQAARSESVATRAA